MMKVVIASIVVLAVAIVMAMTGRGGGNFYVPALLASGMPMYKAATTAQLILVMTAVAALLVFHRHRMVDWKLALVIDPPTDVMAFIGGYYAHTIASTTLKIMFAGALVLAAVFMLRPAKKETRTRRQGFGFWRRNYNGREYVVNLWLVIPITAVTGLVAGMIGVSGGSFKIPLMVLACGVPMGIAVGTSSAMVAATALMGFLGHSIRGDFDPTWAIPLVLVAVVGGLIGGKLSVKTKPKHLKHIFTYTTLAAAAFMILNAFALT